MSEEIKNKQYAGENTTKAIIKNAKNSFASIDHEHDWNANEGESGHIKNRTHWVENKPIVKDTTIAFVGPPQVTVKTDEKLILGKTYSVIFNNVEYKCVAKKFPVYMPDDGNNVYTISLGNQSYANDFENTNEPFLIAEITEEILEYYGLEVGLYVLGPFVTTSEMTISITLLDYKTHKLDEKFLPDSVKTQADLAQNDETASDYVKNRTHWVEEKTVIVVPEVTMPAGRIPVVYDVTEPMLMDENAVYELFINGEKYTFGEIAISPDGTGHSLESDSVENGESIAVLFYDDANIESTGYYGRILILMPSLAGVEFTLSLNATIQEYYKLDEKFIPDSVKAQADFSQNDETALDYVKNRTHWVEEKIILSETNVVRGPNGVEFSYVIEEGKTYTIKFNGEIYNCKAKSSEIPETLTIGNASLMIGDDTGEPFCIGATIGDTEGGMVFNNLFEDTTVSIVLEEIHKLDNKFLNDDVFTQADFSQNDSSALDYIKNRTHWVEYGRQNLLAETVITLDNGESMVSDDTIKLVDGETYIVNYNGTEYTCVAKPFDFGTGGAITAPTIGNLDLVNETGDTGEPFVIVYVNSELKDMMEFPSAGLMISDINGLSESTISIDQASEIVHKLDKKYYNYTHGSEIIEIFPETTFTEISEDLNNGGQCVINGHLTVDNMCTVIWNGVKYDCETHHVKWMGLNNVLGLGNTGAIAKLSGITTDDPFAIVIVTNDILSSFTPDVGDKSIVQFAVLDGSTSVTLSITGEVIDKIDPKYLPDDIGGSVTKVSELENDTGFITADEVPKNLSDYTNDTGFITADEVPKNLSDYTNDTGFITKSISDLANYYLKTETYSQTEINALISAIPKFSIKVVADLPTSDISETTVYLVSSGEETNNLYTEYIYTDGKWEILGRQKLDLSEYAKTEDIPNNSNLVNGVLALGSLRSITSAEESTISTEYRLGQSAFAVGCRTKASEYCSFAEGADTTASGYYSHAEGYKTTAFGRASHAEGSDGESNSSRTVTSSDFDKITEDIVITGSMAYGNYSHAEGKRTLSYGTGSHSEGCDSNALGSNSHAEGSETNASGTDSHAEGYKTTASGDYSHAEGTETTASGISSHAEGSETTASGNYSNAEGSETTASGDYSHAEGYKTTASGSGSHAEGYETTASGTYSHAEGSNYGYEEYIVTTDDYSGVGSEGISVHGPTAYGGSSHAEGGNTLAFGGASHAEGLMSKSFGGGSHAEGYKTTASGDYSHAEGEKTTTSGRSSHAEGYKTTASGSGSHAEGYETTASGDYSHSEGLNTKTEGNYSHAEGDETTASGEGSHAEGRNTTASGIYSHAEGYKTTASGTYSHTEGYNTTASGDYQHVQGRYNVVDVDTDGNALNTYAHIVGNGTATNTRSNAHTLDWDGNAEYQGDVKANACGGANPISLVETAAKVEAGQDWNQNDSSATDYIKNRTHWVEELTGDILPETTFDTSEGTAPVTEALPIPLTLGNIYTITYNGEVLEKECKSANVEGIDCLGFGNASSFGGEDTGEPFFLVFLPEDKIESIGAYGVLAVFDGTASVTMRIEGTSTIYHKLDKSFLPVSENSNIVNGSSNGSIRTTSAAKESDEYTMGVASMAEGGNTVASGGYSHAEGYGSKATGTLAHAEGNATTASGEYSHSEGTGTTASGESSHAEGNQTKAEASNSHAEGSETTASENSAHAEGANTTASGIASHAEGCQTKATQYYSHAEGYFSESSGNSAHAEGYQTKATGPYSHSEGLFTTASGETSHAEGRKTKSIGKSSHAEGGNISVDGTVVDDQYTITSEDFSYIKNDIVFDSTVAYGHSSHAEGFKSFSYGHASHAEGLMSKSFGVGSHAEGFSTIASGHSSHAEGRGTTASGDYSHAEGSSTTASCQSSHAEGHYAKASGDGSHAEGSSTTASGQSSHAEGSSTTASGNYSHAEGYGAESSGQGSHAEGYYTTASGEYSHAEGLITTASGEYSHAEGCYTKASSDYQHVQGKYNVVDVDSDGKALNTYAHVVGNGRNDIQRSNAHTLDWSGNAWFAGTVEGTAIILKSSTSGSTKRFKITVDDSGTLTATEVTN